MTRESDGSPQGGDAKEWRPIPSLPGYFASNEGEILGLRGWVLRRCPDRYGYTNVNVAGCRKRKVHRLVCEAFHGPCPEGRECGHLDGDKTNNNPKNLAWITRSENIRHQIKHGTFKRPIAPASAMRRGSENTSAKLTEAQVCQARIRHSRGESGRKLAREYGVGQAAMACALRRKTWAHVQDATHD